MRESGGEFSEGSHPKESEEIAHWGAELSGPPEVQEETILERIQEAVGQSHAGRELSPALQAGLKLDIALAVEAAATHSMGSIQSALENKRIALAEIGELGDPLTVPLSSEFVKRVKAQYDSGKKILESKTGVTEEADLPRADQDVQIAHDELKLGVRTQIAGEIVRILTGERLGMDFSHRVTEDTIVADDRHDIAREIKLGRVRKKLGKGRDMEGDEMSTLAPYLGIDRTKAREQVEIAVTLASELTRSFNEERPALEASSPFPLDNGEISAPNRYGRSLREANGDETG